MKIYSENISNSEKDKSIFKKILINNDRYKIGIDEFERVRLEILECHNEKTGIIGELVKIVMEIDNLPMCVKERKKYNRDIANIYQIGLNEGESYAKEYADNLKKIIEKNLMIYRKRDLYKPAIVGFSTIIIIISLINLKAPLNNLEKQLIYGSIGGVLSVIVQNNKFDIDYKVDSKLLRFEAIKLVIVSNIMAIIGGLAIESKIIFTNLSSEDTFIKLVYVLCGYSQTYIPNLLKNFEIKHNDK